MYSKILQALVACALIAAPSLSFGDPSYAPPGLVGWWRGEGNTTDETGAHPGTPVGRLAYVPGQVGRAFSLNGVDAAVALGTWFTLQEFTISFWVKAGSSQVLHADILDNNHSDYRSWAVQSANITVDGASRWIWGANAAGGLYFWITNDAWHHVVASVSADHVLRVYIDGSFLAESVGTGQIPYDGTQFFNLGRHIAYGRYFNGLVDELMVFDRALDPAEIGGIYVNQGFSVPQLDIKKQDGTLLLSWPMSSAGWVLEASPSLGAGANWLEISPPYSSVGSSFQVTQPSPTENKFFRLRLP
jgi:hypothetical protein